MRNWKRRLAALLAACSIAATLPIAASAADEKIEEALEWGLAIAEDNRHGYSQAYRYGPSYDCASFVSTALQQGGFDIDPRQTTCSLRATLEDLGFEVYRRGTVELERGDILLNPYSHVEFYLGDGLCLASHRDYDGRPGDSTGKEINVRNHDWCFFCRYREYTYVIRYPEQPVPEEAEAPETAEISDRIFYLPMEQIAAEEAEALAQMPAHPFSVLLTDGENPTLHSIS